MTKKETFLTLILMLLSAAAGIFVYQQFFIDKPASALKLETNQSSVDTNNIDLSKLIAKEFNGTNVDLTEYRGKHLVINFWATWCAPCRKEIPLFIELQEKYKHQNVQVIGIAMDDAAKAEQYMESIGFNYPSLISDLTQTTRFGQALNYEFIALPFTFFINKDGRLIHTKTGELKQADLDKQVNLLISSNKETNF